MRTKNSSGFAIWLHESLAVFLIFLVILIGMGSINAAAQSTSADFLFVTNLPEDQFSNPYPNGNSFTKLKALVENQGYKTTYIDLNKVRLTSDLLKDKKIVMLIGEYPLAWYSKRSIGAEEIRAVSNFVENGGGLFVTSNVDYNGITQQFGVTLTGNNGGSTGLDWPLYNTDATYFENHPVTEGITRITGDAGDRITVFPPARIIGYQNRGGEPLLAVSTKGAGKVMVWFGVGSFLDGRIPTNAYQSSIEDADNKKFMRNSIKWLSSPSTPISAPTPARALVTKTSSVTPSLTPALPFPIGRDDIKFVEIFKDDFEDENTVGWQFTRAGEGEKDRSSTWKVESEGSNHVLSGEEHTFANVKGLEVADFSIETKFKFIRDEGFRLNVRDGENGRYSILFDINSATLFKGSESWIGGYKEVALQRTFAQLNTNTWYTAKILILGNNIKVYVDNVLKIDYVDFDSPLFSGQINFETGSNSHIHFDDLKVQTPAREFLSAPLKSFNANDLFLARVISALVFFILIISTVIFAGENTRAKLSSHTIAGLSAYGILDLVGNWSDKTFLVIGFGAAVFGILLRNKRMTASLVLKGFVSFVAGFAMFVFIVGNPYTGGSISLPALLIWGCIHGIGVAGINKNFRAISIVAITGAFGLLLGFVSADKFLYYFGLPRGPPFGPFGYGIFGAVLGAVIGASVYYVSLQREKLNIEPKVKPEPALEELEEILDIKRGYAVLPNNDIKFGIRITNNTGYTITDVDTILDYTEELFKLKKSKLQRIGNIPPDTARTAAYILKPLGCIHNENINAIVSYTDATGKKHALHMRPKEVHCVCPFLKEKPLSEGEYGRLAASSEFVQEGISFKGISVEELSKFMGETCRHMLYKVREYDLEGKRVIYLSGESLGEKAYYLLTAVIQEYKGLTQVVLRAHSDKKYGLNGFMNEMADSIRHLVGSVQNAKEIGIIENTQVINIIDSVVQRTSFDMSDEGNSQVNIKDSMVQRTDFGKNKRGR